MPRGLASQSLRSEDTTALPPHWGRGVAPKFTQHENFCSLHTHNTSVPVPGSPLIKHVNLYLKKTDIFFGGRGRWRPLSFARRPAQQLLSAAALPTATAMNTLYWMCPPFGFGTRILTVCVLIAQPKRGAERSRRRSPHRCRRGQLRHRHLNIADEEGGARRAPGVHHSDHRVRISLRRA